MADTDSRTGTRYADAAVLNYVNGLHAPHDGPLASAFEAPERTGLMAIQVGPSEGKLLGMLLRMAGARRVLEIGTLAGYSALHMARALPADGHLWSVDNDPQAHDAAAKCLSEAGLDARVTLVQGDARQVIEQLADAHAPFDAIFIDADKQHYDVYGEFAARHLRTGGLLLGDNAYFFGKLLEDSDAARAMRRFHERAAEAFDTVCIPTPDGLLLGVKRPEVA